MNSNEKRPDRLVGFLNVATYFAPMALLVLTGFFRLLDTIGAVNTDAGLIRALGDMAGTLLLLPILFALLGFYNLFAGLTCRAYGLEGRFVERHRFTAAALSLLLAFFLLHEARPTLEPLWTLAGFVAMLAGMAPLTRARPIQVLFLVLLAPLLWIITGFEFV
ncbi:MAG: hypothetical protein U9N14_02780, partial [Pseudomonadota bacterium]|nr:hypothetical protein [Pseudomonadota bacterium]